ncbi:Nuclear transport factor 2 [Phaffia rhodozyma]|uniref:Nuclear transport factor 2 n=1 Tax=Phaffia rhodozyma TaxID=264483 RepID=A0A0F7SQ96_PHARH|nr:Nuclear transport factor 2 [Phaffia rhodozyma]
MADLNAVATSFTQYYYSLFATNRPALKDLYRDVSMLTWEEKQFLSGDAIVKHLVELPFGKVQHKIVTTDAQPSQPGQEHLMVLVTGQLIIDDSPPLQFSQVFQLIKEGATYWVFNDVFRLVYG